MPEHTFCHGFKAGKIMLPAACQLSKQRSRT